MNNRDMTMNNRECCINRKITLFTAACIILLLSACAPSIRGTIKLVDANDRPIPVTVASPEGAVVNMINTSSSVEQASHSVTATADGKFESLKDAIAKGKYQVEISQLGFQTETRTVEVSTFSNPTVDVSLHKILERKRRSIRGSHSDEDKIVNPGEVNIQPPSM
jgi:hypothetical protein